MIIFRGSPETDDQTIVTPGNFESHIGKWFFFINMLAFVGKCRTTLAILKKSGEDLVPQGLELVLQELELAPHALKFAL